MKIKIAFLLLLFFFTTSLPLHSINKIMPLGASRTDGNRPKYESYRYELWKKLISNGWTFDFIGTQKDNASYPLFNNLAFDNDHEGRGGITAVGILAGLKDWLTQAGSPDIVIFESPGGNDFLSGKSYDATLININAIIDVLQENNPNVTIILEQTSPVRSDFATPDLNNALNQIRIDLVTIASNQSTALSKVMVVDMYTGFNDSLLADQLHYNQAGAEFVANRYYNILSEKVLRKSSTNLPEKSLDKNLLIYPTIFSSEINIATSIPSFSYVLYNAQGQLVKMGQNEVKINGSNLPEGFYLLKVYSGIQQITTKLFKYKSII